MQRQGWFYITQLILKAIIIVLGAINLVISSDQVENIFVTDTSNAINATAHYLFLICVNLLSIAGLAVEYCINPNKENFQELYATSIIRNMTSLTSLGLGFIVFGNMVGLCGICEWMFVVIPALAFISDIINNNEDLIARHKEPLTFGERWSKPVESMKNSWAYTLALYTMTLAGLIFGYIRYYIQNTSINKRRFEEKYCDIILITCFLGLLGRFLLWIVGRWGISYKSDNRGRLSDRYNVPAINNTVEENQNTNNWTKTINAPLVTFILDRVVLIGVCLLIGIVETFTFEFINKNYIIKLNEVIFVLLSILILFGKNQV